jgi:hypothetical protein
MSAGKREKEWGKARTNMPTLGRSRIPPRPQTQRAPSALVLLRSLLLIRVRRRVLRVVRIKHDCLQWLPIHRKLLLPSPFFFRTSLKNGIGEGGEGAVFSVGEEGADE